MALRPSSRSSHLAHHQAGHRKQAAAGAGELAAPVHRRAAHLVPDGALRGEGRDPGVRPGVAPAPAQGQVQAGEEVPGPGQVGRASSAAHGGWPGAGRAAADQVPVGLGLAAGGKARRSVGPGVSRAPGGDHGDAGGAADGRAAGPAGGDRAGRSVGAGAAAGAGAGAGAGPPGAPARLGRAGDTAVVVPVAARIPAGHPGRPSPQRCASTGPALRLGQPSAASARSVARAGRPDARGRARCRSRLA